MLFPQEPDAVCRLGDPAKGGNSDPLKDERFKKKKKSLQIHRTLMKSLVVKVDSNYCPSQL